MSGVKIASCAAWLSASRAAPSERSERASSGKPWSSGIRDVERRVARELRIRDGGAAPGARLVALHEVGDRVGGESVAWQAERFDGALDPIGRPLHFHEIV